MATIPEFFAGKNVFLTGVSGFVGKVLVEKLLRSCPDVGNIYVLLRQKKGVNSQDRLQKILAEKLFDNLHSRCPECFTKVKIIPGDLLSDTIISDDRDLRMLREEINVVIHSAASVRFSEPLRRSVEINLKATYKMLELAKTMKNLKSFIHVSTAFSSCNLKEVEERTYPCEPLQAGKMLSVSDWMNEDMLEDLKPKLLGGRPNTYTYTKALAENLVEEYSSQIPIAIVRPSIITGAVVEPLPGWVDNHNGPNGLLVALGTGVLTTLYTRLDCTADLIPVDFVANTILAAAKNASQGFKVYNCTTSSQNPITWRTFMEESADFPYRYPTKSIIRCPHPRITEWKLLHMTRLFLEHYVPARLIDMVLRCAGKKPVLSRIYDRLSTSMDLLEFFTTNEWIFHNTNTRELFRSLHPSDKVQFNFDVSTIHWPSYLHTYCNGIRQYILKESSADLEPARARLRRLKCIRYASNAILAVAAWKSCIALMPFATKTFFA